MALPSLSSQQNNTAFPLLPVFYNAFASQHIETIYMCLVKRSSAGWARSWHAISDEENLPLQAVSICSGGIAELLTTVCKQMTVCKRKKMCGPTYFCLLSAASLGLLPYPSREEKTEKLVRLPVFHGKHGACCCCDSKTSLNWVEVPIGAEKELPGVNTFVLNVKVLALMREKENTYKPKTTRQIN